MNAFILADNVENVQPVPPTEEVEQPTDGDTAHSEDEPSQLGNSFVA